MKTAKTAKSVKSASLVTDLSLFTADEAAKEFYALLCEAHVFNDSMCFYDEALQENEFYERKKRFTAKERNAEKRHAEKLKEFSAFTASRKDSQAFRIDIALQSFHTMKELLTELSDMREARIKSHISYLKHNFKHVCEYQEKNENKKTYFRFVRL